jgi:hypothetical protein
VNGPWILTSAGLRARGFRSEVTSGLGAGDAAVERGIGSSNGTSLVGEEDSGASLGFANDDMYDRESRTEGDA